MAEETTGLKEAYSEKNLNRVVSIILNAYKEKNYEFLNEIYIQIFPESNNKLKNAKVFSSLMLRFHPDRSVFHLKEIEKYQNANNLFELEKYHSIFLIDKLESVKSQFISSEVDYHPNYVWENPGSGFSVMNEENEFQNESYIDFDGSFYNAVKMRMYGNLEIEFPTYYLEDLEEIEFVESQISDLEGIEYCVHAVIVDLSGNEITDLSRFWELTSIEELYLADNQISIIDDLSNLINLRILDISNNPIKEFEILSQFENLEYVNVSGTLISEVQKRLLKKQGLTIIV